MTNQLKRAVGSPHIHDGASSSSIMWSVVVALLPAALWGVWIFGMPAFLVLLVSVLSSVGAEYLLGLASRKNTIPDGSACVTGLLIGMNMPSSIPLYVPVLASLFAIVLVKWVFGGLGANWMNPALGGRVFAFFSFTAAMSTFPVPRVLQAVDTVATATPLALVKTSLAGGSGGQTIASLMQTNGYGATSFAHSVSSITGGRISPFAVDAFFGNMGGSIGEISAFLLILGGIFLMWKKIISWHIPVSYGVSFALLAWSLGGLRMGTGLFSGDILLPLLSGGLVLGAIFMATDMVTSPLTNTGRLIFGCGCGVLTFILRYYGSLPEATSLAILFMNMMTPLIDRHVRPRVYGTGRPASIVTGKEVQS